MDMEKAIRIIDELIFEAKKKPTWKAENALRCVKKELLKEQEPKTGHWIFESQYCEAWTHTCSECGKKMTTAVNMFANWCWNYGAKMTDRR